MKKKHIYLLGFMGSGKSYWGKKLAETLDLPFIDLDDYIESKNKTSISKIFETRGAAKFRHLEQAALIETARLAPSVISLGGGTPCFFDNMEIINKNGYSFYLKTPIPTLVQRLVPETTHRPLLAHFSKKELNDYIANKLEERNPYYELADKVVDSTADVIVEIQKYLKE